MCQLARLDALDQVPWRVEQQAQHIDRVDAGQAKALEAPVRCVADTLFEPALVLVGEDEAAQDEEERHSVLPADDAVQQPRRQGPEQIAVVQHDHGEGGEKAQAREGGQRLDPVGGRRQGNR